MMRYQDLRGLLTSWWAGIFGQARISKPGEGASTLDAVRMADQEGNSPEVVVDLTRLEQFGDIVCPPADTNAAILQKSDGGYVVPLGVPSVRPTDAKPGDRGLYSDQAGTRIQLYGSQQGSKKGDVVVNDGTQNVARKGDRARAKLRATWTQVSPMPPVFQMTLSAVNGTAVSIIMQFTATGAVTIPAVPGVSFDVEVDAEIYEGALHFKA